MARNRDCLNKSYTFENNIEINQKKRDAVMLVSYDSLMKKINSSNVSLVFETVSTIAKNQANALFANVQRPSIECIEDIKGGLAIYKLCFTVWSLIKMKEVIKSLRGEKLKTYFEQFNILHEYTKSLLIDDEVDDEQKLESVFFFLSEISKIIEPNANVSNYKMYKLVDSLLKCFIDFSVKTNSFDLISSIEEHLPDIEKVFLSNRSNINNKKVGVLKKNFNSLRKKMIFAFLDFQFPKTECLTDVEIGYSCVLNLNETNLIKVGGGLCLSIVNVKDKLVSSPVYYHKENYMQFQLMKVNWKFLISEMNRILNNAQIQSLKGYLQINTIIDEIERKFEQDFKNYSLKFEQISQTNTADVKLKGINTILLLKINTINEMIINLQKSKKHLIFHDFIPDEVERLTSKIKILESQIISQDANFEKSKKEKENFVRQNKDLADSKKDLNQQFNNELNEINTCIDEVKKSYASLDKEYRLKIKTLESSIKSKRSIKKEAESKLKDKEKEVVVARRQVGRQKQKKEKINTEISDLQKKLSELKISIEEKSARKDHFVSLNKIVGDKIENLKIENEEHFRQLQAKDAIYHQNRNSLLIRQYNEHREVFDYEVECADKFRQTFRQNEALKQQIEKESCIYEQEIAVCQSLNDDLVQLKKLNRQFDKYSWRSPQECLKSIFSQTVIPLSIFERHLLLSFTSGSSGIMAFYYGGRVRDGIRNKKSRDLDIVVFLSKEQEQKILLSQGYYKNKHIPNLYQKQVKHQNESYDIDVSVYRPDEFMSFFKKPFLTINSLLADETGRVYDAHGAIKELTQSQYITVIGDIYMRIQKDPFRIPRLIGTAARFNMTICNDYWEAIAANGKRINKLPLGKYLGVLDKLFKHESGDIVLSLLLKQPSLFVRMFPFLAPVQKALGRYENFLREKLVDINRGLFVQNQSSPHLNNAYLAILLVPLFSACSSVDNESKAKIVSQTFWQSYKGDVGGAPNHLKEKVNINLEGYLLNFSNEISHQNRSAAFINKRSW